MQPLPTDNTNCWIFLLAGQSNMAGRGQIMPSDTLADPRIFALTADNEFVLAKEPLHWYEPERTGLDCGLSFARAVVKPLPAEIRILLVPTAVGGSSLRQWLGDSVHRGVRLYSNFLNRLEAARKSGIVKGILWHQGEADANDADIPRYKERVQELFARFRTAAGDTTLPVFMGELGSFSKDPAHFARVNAMMHELAATDSRVKVISTGDLHHRGDSLHFDSKGQRTMGRRFAAAFLQYTGIR